MAATLPLGACATGPLAWVAGPARAAAANVALVSQTCGRENDPNWSSYADILGLDLWIRVDDTAASPISFDPAQVTLLAGHQSYRPRRGDATGMISPGASRTFVVHFWERDADLACNVPMALGLDGAVKLGSSAATLAPISFLTSHDDS